MEHIQMTFNVIFFFRIENKQNMLSIVNMAFFNIVILNNIKICIEMKNNDCIKLIYLDLCDIN